MTPDLYPAIDLRAGKVVRLLQGDYSRETVYGDDPVKVAESFANDGASWIHIVDLDAARSGDPVNRPVISRIAAALRGRTRVQTGGGIRSVEDAITLSEAGVERVVMGSAAVRDPSLVSLVSEIVSVAVGLDHRGGTLAVHGWTESSDLRVDDALELFPTASAFVITDIARDGMLSGPDVVGLADSARKTSTPVVASGGVGSLDDVRALSVVPGLAGIITGRAIYEGRFSVRDAIKVLRGDS